MSDTLIERLRGDWPYRKVESHWIEMQNREAADRIEALEAALREAREALERIAMEAERENGGWVHLKRSIAINARLALEPKT